MANGRGTADCLECQYHSFAAQPTVDGCCQATCGYYAIDLPRGLKPEDRLLHPHIGSLNLFCTRYTPKSPTAPQLPAPLRASCRDDVLYGISYNDIGAYFVAAPSTPPESLVALCDLPSTNPQKT